MSSYPVQKETSEENRKNKLNNSNSKDEIKENSNTKLFVGGLSQGTKEEDVYNYFKKFGNIKSVKLMYDSKTNESRRFGFAIFESKEAVTIILNLQPHFIKNKQVDCKLALPKHEKIDLGVTTGPLINYTNYANYTINSYNNNNMNNSMNNSRNLLLQDTFNRNLNNFSNKFINKDDRNNKNSNNKVYSACTMKDFNEPIANNSKEKLSETINNNNKEDAEVAVESKKPKIHDDIYSKKLFLGGLKPNIHERDLVEFFIKFGPISECFIKRKNEVSRGFGFLIFSNSNSLEKVMEYIKRSPVTIKSSIVECKPAVPREGYSDCPNSNPTNTTNSNNSNSKSENSENCSTNKTKTTKEGKEQLITSDKYINKSSESVYTKQCYDKENNSNSVDRKLSDTSYSTEDNSENNSSLGNSNKIFNEVLLFNTNEITIEASNVNNIQSNQYNVDKTYFDLIDNDFYFESELTMESVTFDEKGFLDY